MLLLGMVVYIVALMFYTINAGLDYFENPADSPQIVYALLGWALFIFALGFSQ